MNSTKPCKRENHTISKERLNNEQSKLNLDCLNKFICIFIYNLYVNLNFFQFELHAEYCHILNAILKLKLD